MAGRSVPWRRACPDEVERCFEAAANTTLYILHQAGPTGFILKEEGRRKKAKVRGQSQSQTEPRKWTINVCVLGVPG